MPSVCDCYDCAPGSASTHCACLHLCCAQWLQCFTCMCNSETALVIGRLLTALVHVGSSRSVIAVPSVCCMPDLNWLLFDTFAISTPHITWQGGRNGGTWNGNNRVGFYIHQNALRLAVLANSLPLQIPILLECVCPMFVISPSHCCYFHGHQGQHPILLQAPSQY